MPNCSDVRRKARFNIYFDKVDIEKLVQTVSDATCSPRPDDRPGTALPSGR
jgi:hypothetical protein